MHILLIPLSAVSYELGNNLASKKKAFSSCNDLSIFGGSSLVGLREDSSYPRSFGDKSKEVSRKPEVLSHLYSCALRPDCRFLNYQMLNKITFNFG